jgi:hypothetical protein
METEKAKILLSSIKDRYDFVIIADNALEYKAGILLGFEIAIIIGFLSFVMAELSGAKFFEGLTGIIFLAISMALLFAITWPRKYASFSVNILEHKDYLKKTEEDLLEQMISDSQDATSRNKKISENKANLYKWSMRLLIASLFLLVLSKAPTLYV